MVMAFLMWKENISWLQAFDAVNNVRKIALSWAVALLGLLQQPAGSCLFHNLRLHLACW